MELNETAQNAITRSKYSRVRKIGEGTYAVVYLGRKVESGRIVAIKKIKIGQFKDGLDLSAVREVKYLRELQHENVIELLDVFTFKKNLSLVLEYLELDLEILRKDRSIVFSAADIKSWMLMLLNGLHHCHQQFILHRDLKPSNLLISSDGVLKIADFGLSRDFGVEYRNMTSQVVTRWYRAPELLLGARNYSDSVDMWSVGCIFAELMLRTPYMTAESDLGQLDVIFQALGTPTEEEWPGLKILTPQLKFKSYPRPELSDLFTAADQDALHLLHSLLMFDPLKRLDAGSCIRSEYFKRAPLPTLPQNLPKPAKRNPEHVADSLKRKPDDLNNLQDHSEYIGVAKKLAF